MFLQTFDSVLLKCYNFSLDSPISKIFCFSGALKRALSNYVFKSDVILEAIFGKKPWAITHGFFPDWLKKV